MHTAAMGRSGATLRALLVVATVLAAGPSAACQQEARRPTFVQVVDADGAPVVGAAVSFAGGAPHLSGALQSTDVVEVAADARGRAVGRLLAGRCYVAWATGPDDGDGPRSESAVTGFFAAGAMLELVCLPSQRGGLPRLRPPYVAQGGLFGGPAPGHNSETL